MKRCFVTVGSTRFDSLIKKFFHNDDKLIDALIEIGIEIVTIQNGSGEIPELFGPTSEHSNCWHAMKRGVKFQLFCYKRSIRDDLIDADIIIGHAGAGTCLEVLELNKPFIAVVNTALMDNHQSELAEKLAEDGHILFTTLEGLARTLLNPTLFVLKPLERANPLVFRQFMELFLTIK